MEYLGPLEAVMERARADFEKGEYRWVAQLMSQLVFADAGNEAARALLRRRLEQLGYQAESATWRNAYLLAAQELRHGIRPGRPIGFLRGDMLPALATAVVFDWLGVRLNAEKAAGLAWKIDWRFTDRGEVVAQTLENATLTQRIGKPSAARRMRASPRRAPPSIAWWPAARPSRTSSPAARRRWSGTPRCRDGSSRCSTCSSRCFPSSPRSEGTLRWRASRAKWS